MDVQSNAGRKRPGFGTALLLVFGFGLLGVLLACLGIYLWPANLFHPFRALPALPEPVAHLRGATVDTVTVESASGRLYAFDIRETAREAGRETAGGWVPVTAARSESDEPCEPFAEKAPAIADVRERRIACDNLADAGVTSVYVLRGDGRVWFWSRFDSAYMSLAVLLLVPLLLGGLGALAGLVVFFISRSRSAGR